MLVAVVMPPAYADGEHRRVRAEGAQHIVLDGSHSTAGCPRAEVGVSEVHT